MNPPPVRPAAAPWSTAFFTRLYRYKSLLLRRWWILLLTICCGLFVEAWLIFQTPPSFQSASKMMLAGKLNVNQNAVYSEDNVNFYGTQIQLMQSTEVRRDAESLVRATHPELRPVPVDVNVVQRPRTSIFELQAIGSSPDYTQVYLNAVMQKYLEFKKGMRQDQTHTFTTGITEQLIQVEKDLRAAEDEMLDFQKQNNIGFIQEEGNSAAQYLVKLNQDYARLKTEYELLEKLDLDQNLDRGEKTQTEASPRPSNNDQAGMPFSDVGPEGDYLKAKQQVQLLKAERDTLSQDLRPRHPKIIKLNDEISKQEKLIELFRSDAFEKLETRRKSIGKQMENLQGNIKEWEVKALDLSQSLAQFNRIKGKVERIKLLYDRLTNDLKSVDVSQVIDTGDQISIMEPATPPVSVRLGLLKSLLLGFGGGALVGIVILLLLDRIDDRMASYGEFQRHFSENVVGQIPKEKVKGRMALLQPDDPRPFFAEPYRNIRSSLLFLPTRGRTLSQPSEHLLRQSTDQFLKEIYHQYDYIIVDSSPVLAADDTTSLAPKIDATLLVIRLSYTSARLTKKALELLYSRQVNVPGIILNYVDTSLPEYYYYQYSEYYNRTAAPSEAEATAQHSSDQARSA